MAKKKQTEEVPGQAEPETVRVNPVSFANFEVSQETLGEIDAAFEEYDKNQLIDERRKKERALRKR